MGIFVNYPSNIFSGLSNTPQTIVTADQNVLWVIAIIVCNRGAAPIRFNLQKVRTQGLVLEKECYVATTSNLIATYNNGVAGVGATLTNNGTLGACSIDGLFPALNARILVKDQNSTFQNGIYTVTKVGSNSIAWILTRSTDFNRPSQIKNGDLVFVTNGLTNSNKTLIQTSNVTTIGIDPIIFTIAPSTKIFYVNELEIKPYDTVDIIDKTGVLNLECSFTPGVIDSLVCFSNGYTQKFDCEVNYAKLNELP